MSTGRMRAPVSDKSSEIRQYEELIEEYYRLSQEYAILESESAGNEPCEGTTQDELVTEMAEHRSKLEDLCETFDEEDYKTLFEREDE